MSENSLSTQDNAQYLRDQLAKAWSRMVACITHDLTTPLASIRMTGDHVSNIMSDLIEGYQLAVTNNLIESDFNDKRLNILKESLLPQISTNITHMLDFLHLTCNYNQKLMSISNSSEPLYIKTCLDSIIDTYPFADDKERALLEIDYSHNFIINCDSLFIQHLFANLLRNALFYITMSGKGNIKIWTKQIENYNIVHFKDTASGMSESTLARVFERFFATRDNNIVPGLGYCRLALLQSGGDIICHSIKGEYTDFVIKFCKSP